MICSETLQNFSCNPMIPTNDFLQEHIYKHRLHLAVDEFYSGFSHATLVEKNLTKRTGIRSCNIEREFSNFCTLYFLGFAMIWTLCENQINFMCKNQYSEGIFGIFIF